LTRLMTARASSPLVTDPDWVVMRELLSRIVSR
jgi:hypothetical protein